MLLTNRHILSNNIIMKVAKRDHILTTALEAFHKYGFKRISMKEIAEFAGISRAGLYNEFKTKEEVLNGAIRHYADTLIAEINKGIETKKSTEDKILYAFEVWSIRSFDEIISSPEAKELLEGGITFAQESYDESYLKLESIITSILKLHFKSKDNRKVISAENTARIIVSASRGFKIVAKNSKELRKMIQDQILLILK